MTSSLILNEALMIKDRLREAYNTIKLISDNDFIQDSIYKHSHQVLHARIKKLENEEENEWEVARYVDDVIPHSNLAKYGRYPYNEFRERSYTPNTRGASHLHPYLYKWDLAREPWMMPDVEQVFAHTLYSSSQNFNLYENEMERLEKMDEYGNEPYHEFFSFCDSPDYQKSSTSSLDKSPGRSSKSSKHDQSDQDLNLDKELPFYFNVTEFDAYNLRQKILSDDVRHLWDKRKFYTKDRILEVYKSLLENIVFNEGTQEFRHALKPDDSDLKKLVQFIIDLNMKIPNPMGIEDDQDVNSAHNDSLLAPQRRLYSDVVQGNSQGPAKSTRSLHESSSPLSNGYAEDFPSAVTSSTGILHTNGVTKSASDFIDRFQEQLDAPSTSSIRNLDLDAPEIVESTSERSPVRQQRRQSPNKFSYSEAVNNTYGYPINQCNMPFLNDTPSHESHTKVSSTGTSYPTTIYNSMQYVPDTNTYTTSTNFNRLGYSNSTPTYASQTYTNQINAVPPHSVPMNRTQNVNPNWYVAPPCRHTHPPTPYSVLLLPQMPTKHRWTNPQYMRPSTPTTSIYNSGSSQNQPTMWPSQPTTININRSASNHQVNNSCYSIYDPTKIKKKTIAPTVGKFPRNKTPETVVKTKKFTKISSSTLTTPAVASTAPKYPCKILTKPHSDFRIMARQDGDRAASPSAEKPAAVTDPLIPVSCSESDELEKIALREYQPSNEMFFTEIERQAEEQYDGNPENSCRPPNSGKCFVLVGGLRALYFIFHLYFSINTR